MTLLKDYFDLENLKNITQVLSKTAKIHSLEFNSKQFESGYKKQYKNLELKQRVCLITKLLYECLPYSYEEQLKILVDTLVDDKIENNQDIDFPWKNLPKNKIAGFNVWHLTEFVKTYGLEHFDISMNALYEMTKRFSSEFAIRDFINQEPKKTYKYFYKWIHDDNHHVRRLVSEGSRPFLPWATRLNDYDSHLKSNIKILNYLKDDSSEYVRRSVANHLNDISKFDSYLVIKTISKWNLKKKNLQRIASHALRTLIKNGNKDALSIMGYETIKYKVNTLKVKKTIKLNSEELVSYDIDFKKNVKNIMIDYAVYYMKANGKQSKKVFKHRKLTQTDRYYTDKIKLKFKQQSTRKLYPGKHQLSLIINGVESERIDFNLKFS